MVTRSALMSIRIANAQDISFMEKENHGKSSTQLKLWNALTMYLETQKLEHLKLVIVLKIITENNVLKKIGKVTIRRKVNAHVTEKYLMVTVINGSERWFMELLTAATQNLEIQRLVHSSIAIARKMKT